MVERIKELCKERNTSVRQLEADLGFGNGYIKKLRPDNIGYERLMMICKKLETTPEYILYGDNGGEPTGSYRVPVLGKVAAGLPIYASENIIDYEELPLEKKKTGEWFGLRIKGDSMYPVIMDGDTIICKKTSTAVTGEIVVALIDGEEATCKQLIRRQDGITLKSLNEDYGNFQYTNEQISTLPVEIIGTVYEIRRKTPIGA